VKYRDIAMGTRAIKRVPLPQVNVPSGLTSDVPELATQREQDRNAASPSGVAPEAQVPQVGLRILTGVEYVTVAEKALAFAKSRGSNKADGDDPIYNLGTAVYTLALACVDPDSDPRDPDPFFGERGDLESAVEQILESPHLGRDGIFFLSEAHELWQDVCNPRALKLSPQAMYAQVAEIAQKADITGFLALRPGMQWNFVLFMASLLWNLLKDKSVFSAVWPDAISSSTSPEADPS
jgi:hypothetical protein